MKHLEKSLELLDKYLKEATREEIEADIKRIDAMGLPDHPTGEEYMAILEAEFTD
jgi:hypothetical protein